MRTMPPPTRWDQPPRAAERVARAWALSIAGTSYVSMGGREVQDFLTSLATRLIRALTADKFEPTDAYEVGGTLVAAHFTQPETLERTLAVLAEQFTRAPQLRVAQIQGALAAGYAQALRDRVLDEQEEIRTAALWARARAEEARWSSEARFRAVFAGAAIGMSIAGVDGHLMEVNQALCDMLGYTEEELLAKRVEDFFHAEDEPHIWEQYGELVAGQRDHLRVEKSYLHKDGHMVWADAAVSLIRDQADRPRFVVAMVEDITERHLLQLRLRH